MYAWADLLLGRGDRLARRAICDEAMSEIQLKGL